MANTFSHNLKRTISRGFSIEQASPLYPFLSIVLIHKHSTSLCSIKRGLLLLRNIVYDLMTSYLRPFQQCYLSFIHWLQFLNRISLTEPNFVCSCYLQVSGKFICKPIKNRIWLFHLGLSTIELLSVWKLLHAVKIRKNIIFRVNFIMKKSSNQLLTNKKCC